ncbi:hypothetical protein [Actinomadura rudentiformis]|uniref:Uncharacterized protein n=1 Tax=Actinomadura rudentiformis TaxID=359158 RepID=A0A6H9Z2P3_9ACTN|nr:hypothetical protein [Actinomadura rudentiformis]KAB2352312.1 hypothetical protein F8566_01025 [Actinomadura rudentiformis]
MKSMARFVAAAALVAGGIGFAAAPATAATGRLTLADGTTGRTVTYINPAPGCYDTIRFDTVANRTNTPVTAYTGERCQGQYVVVMPGTNPIGVGPRLSVAVP